MLRFAGIGVGFLFVLVLLWGLVQPREDVTPDPVKAIHLHPRQAQFAHDGPLGIFGTYDRAQLQRGFQVYKEVCAACHSLRLVAFRNLTEIGFSQAEVVAIAKGYEVPAINPETGEASTRPALPSDHFPSPFPNAVTARLANNNALPPDLSLIVKARHDGQNYLYSLLTGYDKPVPAGFEVPPGLNFNPYFHSVNIAMVRPLQDDQISYADGTKATTDQMAKDVTAFLRWAAEPELESRRQIGVATVLFLLILSVLAFLTYRKVWSTVPH